MSSVDLDNETVRLTLSVSEIITLQTALKVAKEQHAVTVEFADSAHGKLDKAIDRWAGV